MLITYNNNHPVLSVSSTWDNIIKNDSPCGIKRPDFKKDPAKTAQPNLKIRIS